MSIISVCFGYDAKWEPVCATLGENVTVWAKSKRGTHQGRSHTGLCCQVKEFNGKFYAEIDTSLNRGGGRIFEAHAGERIYGLIDTHNVVHPWEEVHA